MDGKVSSCRELDKNVLVLETAFLLITGHFFEMLTYAETIQVSSGFPVHL